MEVEVCLRMLERQIPGATANQWLGYPSPNNVSDTYLESTRGVRCRKKTEVEELESMLVDTQSTATLTDSPNQGDGVVHFNMVENN